MWICIFKRGGSFHEDIVRAKRDWRACIAARSSSFRVMVVPVASFRRFQSSGEKSAVSVIIRMRLSSVAFTCVCLDAYHKRVWVEIYEHGYTGVSFSVFVRSLAPRRQRSGLTGGVRNSHAQTQVPRMLRCHHSTLQAFDNVDSYVFMSVSICL